MLYAKRLDSFAGAIFRRIIHDDYFVVMERLFGYGSERLQDGRRGIVAWDDDRDLGHRKGLSHFVIHGGHV